MTDHIRALRNNNPGNIRIGEPWYGLMPRERMNPEQAAETAFCVFATPAYGFRAMSKVLFSYYGIFHGAGKVFSIDNIVARWAPASENDTGAYAADVASRCAVARAAGNEPTRAFLRAVEKALATHEAGAWLWKDADLDEGLTLAGF